MASSSWALSQPLIPAELHAKSPSMRDVICRDFDSRKYGRVAGVSRVSRLAAAAGLTPHTHTSREPRDRRWQDSAVSTLSSHFNVPACALQGLAQPEGSYRRQIWDYARLISGSKALATGCRPEQVCKLRPRVLRIRINTRTASVFAHEVVQLVRHQQASNQRPSPCSRSGKRALNAER